MKYTAIILAGGKSSRMGSDKGLVLLNGKPMISYIIEILKKMQIPIIIISNNENYKQFGLPVFADIIKEKGPLGGIYTGLKNSKTESNIIVSCDVPFLSNRIIELLINKDNGYPISVVQSNGKTHPLIGLYSKKIVKKLFDTILLEKLKVRSFIEEFPLNTIELDKQEILEYENEIRNINTQEELKNIEYGK
jgi:molybdopterin-guanine dinucleotide biosynthesis protein A